MTPRPQRWSPNDWDTTERFKKLGPHVSPLKFPRRLNRYYPERAFDGDVFQTWNAHAPPKHALAPDIVLPRVVQKWPQTPKLHAAIERLQGTKRFYFAGAHAVPGMGLLEQACQAGEQAADRVLADLDARDDEAA